MYRLFFESEFLSTGDCAKTNVTPRVNNTLNKYFLMKSQGLWIVGLKGAKLDKFF